MILAKSILKEIGAVGDSVGYVTFKESFVVYCAKAYNSMLKNIEKKTSGAFSSSFNNIILDEINKSHNLHNRAQETEKFSNSNPGTVDYKSIVKGKAKGAEIADMAQMMADDVYTRNLSELSTIGTNVTGFNTHAKHFNDLTETMVTDILLSESHREAVNKATLYTHMAKVLLDKGDYDSAEALNGALNNNNITRTGILDFVPKEAQKHIAELDHVFSPSNNRKNQKDHMAQFQGTKLNSITTLLSHLEFAKQRPRDETLADGSLQFNTHRMELMARIIESFAHDRQAMNKLQQNMPTPTPKTNFIQSVDKSVKLSDDQAYTLSKLIKERPSDPYDKKAVGSDKYQNTVSKTRTEIGNREHAKSAPPIVESQSQQEPLAPQENRQQSRSAPANMENQVDDTNIKKDNQNIEATESTPKQQKEEPPSNDSEPLKRSPKVPPLDLKSTKSKQETKVPRLPNVQDLKASDLTFTNPPIKQEKASPDSEEQAKTASQDARSIIPEGRTRSLTSLWESKIKQSRGQNSQSKQQNKNDSVSVTTRPKIK